MTCIPTVLLVIGDPNGIGPEIAVKAALSRVPGLPRMVLVGDPHVVTHYSGAQRVRVIDNHQAPAASVGVLDLIAVEGITQAAFHPGDCNAASGQATVAYVDAALQAAKLGIASAIVACPHNETAINAAGISFSGYPSLLARLAGISEEKVFLMLVGGGLRIVHATLHERLADALRRLDTELVAAAARAAHGALVALGMPAPRIGIFGINPHAGENGLFGTDDDRVTGPAVRILSDEGIDVTGPAGADLLLSEGKCDGYVAMYHDQGHIPVKLVAGRKSAALSIGAGVVFASVGHGSAPDIAGQDKADIEPVLHTLRMICSAVTPSENVLAA